MAYPQDETPSLHLHRPLGRAVDMPLGLKKSFDKDKDKSAELNSSMIKKIRVTDTRKMGMTILGAGEIIRFHQAIGAPLGDSEVEGLGDYLYRHLPVEVDRDISGPTFPLSITDAPYMRDTRLVSSTMLMGVGLGLADRRASQTLIQQLYGLENVAAETLWPENHMPGGVVYATLEHSQAPRILRAFGRYVMQNRVLFPEELTLAPLHIDIVDPEA